MRLSVKDIFQLYHHAVAELAVNTAEAKARGADRIKDFGGLISKIETSSRILRGCEMEVEISSRDARSLK